MTARHVRMLVVLAGVLLVVMIAWASVSGMYLKPKAAIEGRLAEMQNLQSRVEDVMDEWFAVKDGLKSFSGTQLAGQFDEAEHRLRTNLQQIASQHGLVGVQVSNAPVRPERTPLAGARLRSRLGRSLAEARDFGVIRGAMSGAGTLEQVATALATVQAQPWLHRIDRVTIEPRGRERMEFTLEVGFSVVFAPDLVPAGHQGPAIVAASEEDVAQARAFAARNVFVVPSAPPPPPPPPPVVVPEVAPPPAPPPYDRWRVTGVLERRVDGRTIGVEVWMLQVDSGEQRVLVPGQDVLGHVLEWGEGEKAVFVFEGVRYEVMQGRTLADRVASK